MEPKIKMSQTQLSKTIIGLTISLIAPLIIAFGLFPYISSLKTFENYKSIIGLVFMWCVLLLLIVHITLFEKRKLKSVGLVRINLKQILLATGLGILFSLLIPTIYNLIPLLFGNINTSIDHVSQQPFFVVFFGIITAAITEEFLLRAYPLERLKEISNSNVPGIILSLTVFCLLHVNTWNLVHILGVVLPLGLILTFVYLKTKNLIFIMIVHFMIDFPLLFF